ncbi:thioredoxin family protein [Candidatus Woesearchaeota archaeon]|nr:thioredoxin family protein [Candidatus Woesearchaeota archaeon]
MPVLDDRNFESDIQTGVAVVRFASLWDSSSRILEEPFRELSEEFRGKAKFICSDINASPHIAEKQAVTKVPMVIIYFNGKQAARITDVSKRRMREQLEYFLVKERELKEL